MMTGGCLCGAVRYEADGQPLFGLRCYCRDCQRASGGSNVPIMGFPTASLRISGETRAFAVTGGSGNKAIRKFCPCCGSLLFGIPQAAPEITTLYAGTLDDPSAFRADYLQFVRTRPGWEMSGALPEFDGAAPHRPRID